MENSIKNIKSFYPIKIGENDLSVVRDFIVDNNKLDKDLVNWFTYFDPIDFEFPWIFDRLKFVSFFNLKDFQAGYRWEGDTDKIDETWDGDWLVIGQAGGDPIIYNLSTRKIYSAVHGSGSWELKLLADNMDEFLLFVESWLITLSKYNYEILDEDFMPKKNLFSDFKYNLSSHNINLEKYNNFLELL